jgi:tetratricopeptide (TPR) repeat protein
VTSVRCGRRYVSVALFILACGVPHAGLASQSTGVAPQATIERMAALLERNDLPAAKAAVDAALGQHPADPALHNIAGVIDAQQGAYGSAEQHFQTAIRLAPRAVQPYENLGRLYQERTATDPAARTKALETYRRLLTIEPSNVEGLYQAGFLLALEGQFAESRDLVDRLPNQVRETPQTLALLATDLAGTGDAEGAMGMVTRLAAHPELIATDVVRLLPALERIREDRALQAMLEALDTRKMASPDLLQRLAAIYSRQGRFADARQTLERAAASGPTVPLLTQLSRAAYKLGDLEGALGYLAHARSLEPQNANVHFLFGMVCVEMNLGSEAYESLKKAVALDPENPSINYAMGAVATHRHEPSESLPYFEKYVRLMPNDPRGRFALGAARFYSNQFDEARHDLELAARSPQTAAGAHYFLGRIARQSNDLTAARREIDAALEANPKYADAWAELGLLQLRSGQYREAEQSLAKALAIEPENYAATVHLATLYSRTSDPRREEQAARVAVLLEKRAARAQEFLRIIEVVPQ